MKRHAARNDLPNDWRRQHFLEWLCTPPDRRDPHTMKELAAKFHLSEQTFRWNENLFLGEWEIQYRKVVGSPRRPSGSWTS
jgi:hypothetical protein